MPSRLIIVLTFLFLPFGAAAHNFVTGKPVTPIYI